MMSFSSKMSDTGSASANSHGPKDEQITLQVGERRFNTNRSTLIEGSQYFAALLSGRWNNLQGDGSYFVDADGDLFEHILRFLRRGVCPLFFDNAKGHDYTSYIALLEEAKYFGIPRLVAWLQEREYLHAVEIHQTVYKETKIMGELDKIESNVTKEYISPPTWSKTTSWDCPHGIPEHAQRRRACEDYSIAYDHHNAVAGRNVTTTKWEATVLRKEIVFNGEMCVER
jgi:hypothetical protein